MQLTVLGTPQALGSITSGASGTASMTAFITTVGSVSDSRSASSVSAEALLLGSIKSAISRLQ